MSAIAVAGRFTKDAETRYTPKGTAVTSFGIAENVYINGEQTAQFFNCQMFGERGEKLAQYIKKGSPATVFGTLKIRKYTDKSGTERTSVEIDVGDITLQGSKADGEAPKPAKPSAPQPMDDIESDVPF
ncbi:single-strand DNA-binding protein [Neisseria sp. HSC-16F19]|nr:single-stranded DNA-binding protein [Neisseria sp. HSC-16F19]MCP2041905.1 single-strand DNA-binding protein [Neisseria sp. HSC-16F19]